MISTNYCPPSSNANPRHRGGARGVPGGASAPPKFCLAPPVAPSKFFRSSSESPTQTIDSSPCCKTGPSSGPPKWKCLAPPLPRQLISLLQIKEVLYLATRDWWPDKSNAANIAKVLVTAFLKFHYKIKISRNPGSKNKSRSHFQRFFFKNSSSK